MDRTRSFVRSEKLQALMLQFRAGVPKQTLLTKEADEATFWLYGFIDDMGFSDSISPKQMAEALVAAKGAKVLHLRINSPGGDAFGGMAMYNMLAQSPIKKIVHIDGLVASAATLPALAGDEVRTGKASMWMIHNAKTTIVYGGESDFRTAADMLAKVNATAGEVYAKHTGMAVASVRTMMDAETYMTPEEAVSFGFAKSIEENGSVEHTVQNEAEGSIDLGQTRMRLAETLLDYARRRK